MALAQLVLPPAVEEASNRARLVAWVLGSAALFGLLLALLALRAAGAEEPSPGLASLLLTPMTVLRVLALALLARWAHRAGENLGPHLRVDAPPRHLALSTLALALPLVGLALPYLALRRLWRASDPEQFAPTQRAVFDPRGGYRATAAQAGLERARLPRSALGVWWVLDGLHAALAPARWFLPTVALGNPAHALRLAAVTLALQALTGLAAAYTVYGVDQRQRERARRIAALASPEAA